MVQPGMQGMRGNWVANPQAINGYTPAQILANIRRYGDLPPAVRNAMNAVMAAAVYGVQAQMQQPQRVIGALQNTLVPTLKGTLTVALLSAMGEFIYNGFTTKDAYSPLLQILEKIFENKSELQKAIDELNRVTTYYDEAYNWAATHERKINPNPLQFMVKEPPKRDSYSESGMAELIRREELTENSPDVIEWRKEQAEHRLWSDAKKAYETNQKYIWVPKTIEGFEDMKISEAPKAPEVPVPEAAPQPISSPSDKPNATEVSSGKGGRKFRGGQTVGSFFGKGKKPHGAWVSHVKKVAKDNNIKFFDALKIAKKTYKVKTI